MFSSVNLRTVYSAFKSRGGKVVLHNSRKGVSKKVRIGEVPNFNRQHRTLASSNYLEILQYTKVNIFVDREVHNNTSYIYLGFYLNDKCFIVSKTDH